MNAVQEILDYCRVPVGKRIHLKDFDPGYAGDTAIPVKERRKLAESVLSEDVTALVKAQDVLYASDSWSMLLIFQAMDAAGKDGTIKHVMSGINPQGCQVYNFKKPSVEELDHNFLWRCMRCLPERGRIGIFNRSYYEEVLVVKVHPVLVAAQRIPGAKVDDEFWADRYEDINNLERHLSRNGTRVIKFFLNVSKEEQRKRFLKRLEDPSKYWKFTASDLAEREFWDDYTKAYEDMLGATSTEWAPWHVVPADHKWVTRAIVGKIIATEIEKLDLRYPEVTPDQLEQIEAAKKQLKKAKK